MRAVIQRVTRAKVTVDDVTVGEIGNGLVILLGVAQNDTTAEADYLAAKVAALRIFDDETGKMNLSLREVNGAALVVSQFTLYGDVRRGLRPSWSDAAAPEVAEPLYEYFVQLMKNAVGEVATGSFQKMMLVELVNDGPVTLIVESR